jgi:hypothetical protein
MSLPKSLEFYKGLEEIPVKVIDKQSGKTIEYVLREMEHPTRCAYLDEIYKNNLTVDENGNTRCYKYEGLAEALLTRSLFHKADGKPVTHEEIKAMGVGSQAVQDMVDASKRLSGLIERGDLKDKAKN